MRTFLTLLALLFAAPALAQGPPPQGRLSDLVVPIAHRLDLTVDPNATGFTGHTEIDLTLSAPAQSFYLHGRDLTVTHAEARTGKMVANPARYSEVLPTGVAKLTFTRPLLVGRHTLALDYTAKFQEGQADGLYRVKVGKDYYAYTQFESIDARRAFPAFDEPGHKTPFTLTITAPTGQKVFSNARETAATPVGAMTKHAFAPTKPLPTYLVALAIGPFDVETTSIAPNSVRPTPLTLRGIAERGQGKRLAFTMANAPKLVGLLEQYFQVAYPYEKLDLMASPIMGGAMENAGLIIYDDTIILTDPGAPPGQLLGLGSVIAHEVAHQWFGDLVTPYWWTDIWLNESFATWAAQKVATQWNPKAGAGVADLAGALDAMNLDSLGHGRPIPQSIATNTDIDSAFDSITYEKGGQVLRMMEGFVGEDAFQKGVHLHLTRHAYGNATSDEFFASIEQGSGNDAVIPAFRSFVGQQGVPLVTIARRTDGGFDLKQERYRPIGVAPGAPQLWNIPLCMRSGEGRRCALVSGSTGRFPPLFGTAPYVVPNAGGNGYYRFDLDRAGWDGLITAAPKLPATEAMTVGDSLWSSFAAGRAPFAQVLDGARALARHPERLAALWIPGEMDGLAQTAFDAQDRAAYGRFVGRLLGPRLAELGLNVAPGAYATEGNERRALRRALARSLALNARDAKTRATLARAGRAVLAGNAAAVDPDYRGLALTVAAQDGGAPAVQTLFDQMIASNDPLFRQQAGPALGSVDSAALAPKVLALAGDPRLRGREPLYLIGGLTRFASTRDQGYSYAVTNFDRLVKSASLLASFTLGFGSGYCSEDRARAVDTALRPKLAKFNLSPLELDRSVETISQCAAFKAAKGAEISAGLASAG